MGFTARAQALIAEIENAGDWGLPAEAFDLPPASDLPASAEAQAADEVKLDARHSRNMPALPAAAASRPDRSASLFDQKPDLVSPRPC